MPIPQFTPDRVVIDGIRPPLIWDDGLYVLVMGDVIRAVDFVGPFASWFAANDDALFWYRIVDGWAILADDECCGVHGHYSEHLQLPWEIGADIHVWLRVEMQDGKARVVTPDGRALAIHIPVDLECFV